MNKQDFPQAPSLLLPSEYFLTKMLFLVLYLCDTISLTQIAAESLQKCTFRLYAVTKLVFGEPSHKNVVCTLGAFFIGALRSILSDQNQVSAMIFKFTLLALVSLTIHFSLPAQGNVQKGTFLSMNYLKQLEKTQQAIRLQHFINTSNP